MWLTYFHAKRMSSWATAKIQPHSKIADVVVCESDIERIAQGPEEVVRVTGGEMLLGTEVQGTSAEDGLAVGNRATGWTVAVAAVRAERKSR